MDWGSVSSPKLGIRWYLQNHVLLGPGEEWKREWLRNIWGRERSKSITKGDKAGNPHLTMSKWEEKSHPATSSVGTLVNVGFLVLLCFMTHFPSSQAVGGWGLKPCCRRWNQAVLSNHWTLETDCDSLGFSLCVYWHKTLGRVSLKEWSPVIPPLSHRVSLKVQVK